MQKIDSKALLPDMKKKLKRKVSELSKQVEQARKLADAEEKKRQPNNVLRKVRDEEPIKPSLGRNLGEPETRDTDTRPRGGALDGYGLRGGAGDAGGSADNVQEKQASGRDRTNTVPTGVATKNSTNAATNTTDKSYRNLNIYEATDQEVKTACDSAYDDVPLPNLNNMNDAHYEKTRCQLQQTHELRKQARTIYGDEWEVVDLFLPKVKPVKTSSRGAQFCETHGLSAAAQHDLGRLWRQKV